MSDHLVPVGQGRASPFDAIKNTSVTGDEYWLARDLMPLMGYADWRNLMTAIDRAKATAHNTGENVDDLFGDVTEKTGGRPIQNIRLTRYAAYLVAMNGDPRKPETAAAQAYFAVRTREAETRPVQQPAIPQTYAEALRAAADAAEQADAARAEAEKQRAIAQREHRALQAAQPKLAKAEAHSGVTEWKTRQNLYREIQQWGDMQGLDLKQAAINNLLVRKGLFIAAGRSDSGQLTRQAVRAGWGRNKKGVAQNGHAYCTAQLSTRGQDVVWRWVTQAVAQYGEELSEKEITE